MRPNEGAQSDWEMVAAQLPSDWRELAKEERLIRKLPEHMGAKVSDISQILRLVLHRVAKNASLRMTVATSAAAGLLVLSPNSLHKWMVKLGPYLNKLLQRMVDSAAFAPQLWAGYNVIVGDATTVQRPGSKGTTARVHFAMRLSDLSARHIEVTDEKGGETARRFVAEPGELWLLDRGYASPPGIASIRDAGADILVRYNRGSLPLYIADGTRLNVNRCLERTGARDVSHECQAHVQPANAEVVQGRLCWLRLPKKKAAQAKVRARREAEGVCDETTLMYAEYVVVFTTVPANRLSAQALLALYRLRWQVELEFKRDKSIGDLDALPNFRPETIYSWICAKLLLQQIAHKIATPEVSFPPGAVGLQLLPSLAASSEQPDAQHRRAVVRDRPGLEHHLRGVAPAATA